MATTATIQPTCHGSYTPSSKTEPPRHRRKNAGRRKRGVITASTFRQLARLLFDIPFLWGTLYRFRAFRAIRYADLLALNMQDKTFGWTVEMQLKACETRNRCVRSPGSVSQTYRHLQNHRHLHRHHQSRLQNSHYPHLPPLFDITPRTFQLKPTPINAILSLKFSGLTWNWINMPTLVGGV